MITSGWIPEGLADIERNIRLKVEKNYKKFREKVKRDYIEKSQLEKIIVELEGEWNRLSRMNSWEQPYTEDALDDAIQKLKKLTGGEG